MDSSPVTYRLNQLIVKDFVIFDKNILTQERNFQYTIDIGFSFDEKTNSLTQTIMLSFLKKEEVFLKLILDTSFEIQQKSIEELTVNLNIRFPKNFVHHITAVSIGALRGIISEKTMNTSLGQLILPEINLSSIITDVVYLDISSKS